MNTNTKIESLEEEGPARELLFSVEGMHCASCAARAQRTANQVEGIQYAEINLLRKNMRILYDGEQETLARLEEAFKQERFDIQQISSKDSLSVAAIKAKEAQDLLKQKKTLIATVSIALVVFILALFHMFAYPSVQSASDVWITVGIFTVQLLLSLVCLWMNRGLLSNGFILLARLKPSMDSLIALGVGVSFVYSSCLLAGFYCQIPSYLNGGSYLSLSVPQLFFDCSCVILAFISFGRYLEAKAKSKTNDALYSFLDLSPQKALKLVGEDYVEVSAETLMEHDRVLIKEGMKLPADGVVVDGGMSVDESLLTGEPLPSFKTLKDTVFAGTVCSSGWGVCEVEHAGSATLLSEIIRTVDIACSSKAPIQKMADKISGIFVPVVIALSLLCLIVWLVMGAAPSTALSYAVSVVVISCPCALGLATPTALMVGIGKAAHAGMLVKNGEVLERAHAIKEMLFDKTGTLTEAVFKVSSFETDGNADNSFILNALFSLEERSQHPLAKALVSYAKEQGAKRVKLKNFEYSEGKGVHGYIDDRFVFVGNQRGLEELGIKPTFSDATNQVIDIPSLYVAIDNEAVAYLTLSDSIKATAKNTIDTLKSHGISLAMLTGDVDSQARAVADQLGITDVYAELLPNEKMELLSDKSKEACIAFVGDGINDAPALALADVSISFAQASDIALQNADIVLVGDNLFDIVNVIDLSRRTFKIIKENLFWALIYNCLCIPLAAGVFSAFGLSINPMIAAGAMAISSLFVVSNSLRLNTWKPRIHS